MVTINRKVKEEILVLFLRWFIKNDIDMSDDCPEGIVGRYLEELVIK